MTFLEFLNTASTAIAMIAGALLSYAVEWFPQYEQLPSRTKRLLFLLLCLAISLLIAWLKVAAGYATPDFEGLWWPAIRDGLAAGGAGTLMHARKLQSEA